MTKTCKLSAYANYYQPFPTATLTCIPDAKTGSCPITLPKGTTVVLSDGVCGKAADPKSQCSKLNPFICHQSTKDNNITMK